MTWYYAEGGEQRGPISEGELDALVTQGTVRPDTLVWREGLADWQPLSQARAGTGETPPSAPAGPAPSGTEAVCSECGRVLPADEVFRHGERSICAACKPVFLQRLREGALLPGQLEYAGFWIRFGAKFVDGLILWVVNMAIGFVAGMFFSAAGSGTAPDATLIIFQVALTGVSVVINLGYAIFFLGKFGATPGKMACKLRVVTPEGQPISWGRATGRCFAELLSGILCYAGYIMVAFDDEKRALHDRLANTRVIKVG